VAKGVGEIPSIVLLNHICPVKQQVDTGVLIQDSFMCVQLEKTLLRALYIFKTLVSLTISMCPDLKAVIELFMACEVEPMLLHPGPEAGLVVTQRVQESGTGTLPNQEEGDQQKAGRD